MINNWGKLDVQLIKKYQSKHFHTGINIHSTPERVSCFDGKFYVL